MFELTLHAGVAVLLRKALATISTVAYTTLVTIQSDRVVMMSPSRRPSDGACALLRIPTPPSDVAVITCDSPVALNLNLAGLIQRLTPAGDESDNVVLTFHGRDGSIAEDHVGFRFTKPESGISVAPASQMRKTSDETHRMLYLPTAPYKYKTLIEIPSGDLISLITKLQHFADDGGKITVSVKATKTGVKFSAPNEELILTTQPGAYLDTADCIIGGIQDADQVSFSFSLLFRDDYETIINTCKLSESVQLLHSPGLSPTLNCALGRLGTMMLYLYL